MACSLAGVRRLCSVVLARHLSVCMLQADDFGSEVIPGAKDMGMHVQAYLYDGYWEDIGTVEAFYDANLALTDEPAPKFRCTPVCSPPERERQA